MSNENTPVDAPVIGEEKKTEKRPRSRKKNPVHRTDTAHDASRNNVEASQDTMSTDEIPAETKRQPRRVKQTTAKPSSDAEMPRQKQQRRSRKTQANKAESKVEGTNNQKKRNTSKKPAEEPSGVPKETSPGENLRNASNETPGEIFHADLTDGAEKETATDTAGHPQPDGSSGSKKKQPEKRAVQGHIVHRNVRRPRRGKKQEISPPDSQQTSHEDKPDIPPPSFKPIDPVEYILDKLPSEGEEPPDDSDAVTTIRNEAENVDSFLLEPAGECLTGENENKADEIRDPWDSVETAPHIEAALADTQSEDWEDEAPPPLRSRDFDRTDAAHDDWDDGYETSSQKTGKKDQNGNELLFDLDEEIQADSPDDTLETKPKKHQKNKSCRSRNRKVRGEDEVLGAPEADDGTGKNTTESELVDDENSPDFEPLSFLEEDEEDLGQPKRKEAQRKANRKMFFSVLAGERIEVALTQEGKLCEYYLDMQHQKKLKGNIYKGTIQNIDANLQAAFVDYGTMKNGFLQIDEIHSEYWLAHHEPTKGNKFPPIQKVIKPGQEVLVQVVKEPTGNKGAFLTTWLSLAGRFLVLTPGQDQIGVSRKVEDESERARLKELINGIDPGEDMGVIVRTVSEGTTKETLKKDLLYLKRIWQEIREKGTEVKAPALIYSEPGLVERAIRDYLTEDVSEIWVDDETVAETIHSMVDLLFPHKKDMVHLFVDKKQSLWDRFNIRRQIEQVYSREVLLPSGGRLVFDQTEALMAIDVNSGKISCKGNFETMAYKTNMEAAESIALQLRLRDVGGQVVIDFIEMREKKHVEDVERSLRLAMKTDRARYDIEHMSSFGLLELVRQRTGFSALSITQEPCPFCSGTGQRRNLEWQALQVASDIQRQMRSTRSQHCIYETNPELGMYLLNHKRDMLQELEQMFGKSLEISIHRSL